MTIVSWALRTAATGLDAALLGLFALALELARTRFSARLAGGPVAPWGQPLRDLIRLNRKRRIRPDFASPLHGLWPLLSLSATLTLALVVPGFARGTITAGIASPGLLVGLLALGRAGRVLAALDAGKGEPGLAASRAAFAGLWTDIAWLLAFAALELAGTEDRGGVAVLAVAGVLLASPAEAPVPGDYAGPDRALFIVEAALRRAIFLVILVGLAMPAGMADATRPLPWAGGIVLLAGKFALAAGLFGLVRMVLTRGAPRIGLASALLAVLVVIFGPVPADTMGIACGAGLVGAGLVLFWRRWPVVEAAVLVQGGIAMIGLGLGDLRAGIILLAGLALARLAIAGAGGGLVRLCGLAALAGLPPFGLFAGDERIVVSIAAASPPLAALVGAALIIGAIRLVGPTDMAVPVAGRGRAVLGVLSLTLLVALGLAPWAAILP